MATAFVNDFFDDIGNGVHDLSADDIRIAVSVTAPATETSDPTADGNGILANVTQVADTFYSDSLGTDKVLESVVWSQAAGTAKLDAADFSITASGGTYAFRYIYVYNNTPTSPVDPIILYYDHGSTITLLDTQSSNITFNASGIFTSTTA